MLGKLWTKLLLYFKGVRFFPVLVQPKHAELYKVELITVGDCSIEVSFYKEKTWEAYYKLNKINSREVVGYVLKANFDSKCPEEISKYDNMMVFFHGYQLNGLEDKVIFEYLLTAFMVYLKVLSSP